MRCAVRRVLALLAALQAAGTAPAQTVSPAPDTVAVTIYRAPERGSTEAIDRSWLRGYALITEQRRVAIPAGRTTLRFEGVAAGILAESAIVTGLPNGVREKNLDADVLSPRSLYANSFGRPVTIRRTIAKQVVEEPAIIRSGPDGAAILQTRAGFVAVDCGPGHEALAYDRVPPGLSAKPTLSVELDAPTATTTTITVSYLAWGFDWQANYVATLRPGGQSADLFAWVTLASGDVTSFPDAETMVVAGKVARDDTAPYPGPPRAGARRMFRCFAHPVEVAQGLVMLSTEAMDIVVTALRSPAPAAPPPPAPVMVQQEELGDLKLYRVPDRTTVAALAQKQVALLARAAVPVEIVYTARVAADGTVAPPLLTLRAVNTLAKGLGLPLPAGPVALFQPRNGAALLIGEGAIADKAVGETLEARIAAATQVTVENGRDGDQAGSEHILTVRNANPHAIRFEARFDAAALAPERNAALVGKDGTLTWGVTVSANAARTLRYRIADRR